MGSLFAPRTSGKYYHFANVLNYTFISDKVYIAPSGVQKERIEPTHIFVLPYPRPESPHADRAFLRRPSLNLKESQCTPLFWNAFELRGAMSCIHTHSQNAVMATLLWAGPVFRISHQVSFILSEFQAVSVLIQLGRRLHFIYVIRNFSQLRISSR